MAHLLLHNSHGLHKNINILLRNIFNSLFIKSELHLIQQYMKWRKYFINQVKENTRTGGFNIIGIFTNKVPATPDNAPFTKGLFDEGELRKLYEDWEIINVDSFVFEDEHPGGIKHVHAAEQTIAKKLELEGDFYG